MKAQLTAISHVACGPVVCGIVLLLRRPRVLQRTRIRVGLLIAGIVAGVVAMWAWPADVAVLLNLPGVLLGDMAHNASIRFFADPFSARAHLTMPWLLRVPQVCVLVSVLVYGLAGFIVHVAVNRKRK